MDKKTHLNGGKPDSITLPEAVRLLAQEMEEMQARIEYLEKAMAKARTGLPQLDWKNI